MAPPLTGDGVSRLVQCVVVMAEGLGGLLRLLSAAKASGVPSTRARAATIGILFILSISTYWTPRNESAVPQQCRRGCRSASTMPDIGIVCNRMVSGNA